MCRTLAVILWLGHLLTVSLAGDLAVPDWFKPDPANPYAVFEKWRRLDSREAALYLGDGWQVCAGVLRDERGRPIPNCPLLISYHSAMRGYSARLRTDGAGRFIIYSPYEDMFKVPKRTPVSAPTGLWAAPGYPFSGLAMDFAGKNGGWGECKVSSLPVSDNSLFCFLTCAQTTEYNEGAFREFVVQQSALWTKRKRKPFRAQPRAREGSADRGIRNEYRVRLVSPEGKPIPDGLIKFGASDGYEGNMQTVLTDAGGNCTLTEELLAGKGQEYYDDLQRRLTLDVPGYSVGPVLFNLRTGKVNVITAKPGATVSGKLVDWAGRAVRQRIHVEYCRPNYVAFELDAQLTLEGRFLIERIMPDEPFRLRVSGSGHQNTPSAGALSGVMTLRAADSREGIVLTVPQTAALRGIIVDEEGRPIQGVASLVCRRELGWRVHMDVREARFGMHGLAPVPLRIQIRAEGFERRVIEEVVLKPGELRFVTFVLKRKAQNAAVKPVE